MGFLKMLWDFNVVCLNAPSPAEKHLFPGPFIELIKIFFSISLKYLIIYSSYCRLLHLSALGRKTLTGELFWRFFEEK